MADGKLELYNLQTDPKEEHNIADEKTGVTKQLLAELSAWRKLNDVPLPPNSVVKN